MKRNSLYVASISLVLFAYGSILAQSQPSKRKITTPCDIISSPEKYVGKKVRFVAVFKSGFMQPAVLTHASCNQSFIEPSYDGIIVEKIIKNLKDDGSGLLQSAEFMFTGILRKDVVSVHVPIKGLLQNYMMIIKSAKVR